MFAVATLLYDPGYLPGALVLGHTLRKITPTNIKLIVLIEKSAFELWQFDLLSSVWDELIDTNISESLLYKKLVHHLKRPELAKTYTKIELWNLPYEKVLYLDADVLPLEGLNPVTNLLKLDFPRGKILAAPDSGFPDIFNSGVFALTPDGQDYRNLSEIVGSKNNDISFDGADQGLLNQYFNSDPDWVSKHLSLGNKSIGSASKTKDSNWIRIPFLYNTTPNAHYQYYPALNHFGYPGVSFEESGKIDGLGRGLEKMSLGDSSSHGNIALNNFSTDNSRSQISVLHFIGASKPWKNLSSPAFSSWWLKWFEYSQGKLVEAVLRLQPYPVSVNPLKTPSLNSKQLHSPRELCDPSNYQHLSSKVESNTLPWDATKESPPLGVPKSSSFNLYQKPYRNDWDDYKIQEEEHKTHALTESDVSRLFEPERDVQKHIEGSNKSPEFGVHHEQIPERVFDERSDYTPHHPLMMKNRNSLVAGESKVPGSGKESSGVTKSPGDLLSNNNVKGGLNGVRKFNGENREGNHTKLSESNVFPWENRESQPERVWEDDV